MKLLMAVCSHPRLETDSSSETREKFQNPISSNGSLTKQGQARSSMEALIKRAPGTRAFSTLVDAITPFQPVRALSGQNIVCFVLPPVRKAMTEYRNRSESAGFGLELTALRLTGF